MLSDEELGQLTESARAVPPAANAYVDDDLATCLVSTVVDFQMHTTAVERALAFFASARPDGLSTLADLKQYLGRFPDDEAGNKTLAKTLTGYELWTRIGLFRSLVSFLESIGIDDLEGLRAWTLEADFRRDFEGRVRYVAGGRTYGLGLAVFNWLVIRLGVETVKPDVRLRRFVGDTIGRTVSDADIVESVTTVATRLGLSVRTLDWSIWEAGAALIPGPRRPSGRQALECKCVTPPGSAHRSPEILDSVGGVASEKKLDTSPERRRPPRPPGFGEGMLSLAMWDQSSARGGDRGRVTALWDHDRNGDTPDDLSYGSGQVRWFSCDQGHPPWQARVNALTSMRRGCPYCAGKRVAPGMNDLATIRPDLLSEWHPTKNRALSPAQVTPGSHRRVWWRCSSCGWEWSATVGERAGQGTGCPHCSGKTVAVGVDDLATTHPELVAEWQRQRNRPLSPRHVLAESHRVVWWCCSTCEHEWRTEVRLRTRAGTGCPACAGNVPMRGRTFADLVAIDPGEWSARNDLAPEDYTPRSSRRVWRRCLECRSEYEQQVRYWAMGHRHRCHAASVAGGSRVR